MPSFLNVNTCVRLEVIQQKPAPGKPPPKIHHFRNPCGPWKTTQQSHTIHVGWSHGCCEKIFLQTHFWQGKLFSNVGKNYKAPGKCKPNVTLVFFDVTQTLYRCYSAFKHTLKKWNKILFRSQNGFIIIPKNLWNPAGVLCSTPRELKMSLVWPVLNKLVR